MTETAIDSGLFRDLYVSLGEPVGNGAWSVRVYYKPFVGWIWGGALLMALGGGLAVSDRRYALAARKEREARRPLRTRQGTDPGRILSAFIRAIRRFKRCSLLNSTGSVPRARSSFWRFGLRRDPNALPSALINKPAPTFRLPQLKDPSKTSPPKTCVARFGC